MSWPDEIELTLDGIAQGGEGVGRWEDRVVFVAGGLPGERVRVALHDRHASYARGELIELFEYSPDRVPPRDPTATHMPWQSIALPAQLRYKRTILADQLAKIGGLHDAPIEETIAAVRPWGYRTTARLHSDGASIGYYASGSNDLQPLDSDPLLHPALNDALSALASALAEEPVDGPIEVLLRASDTYGYTLGSLAGPGRLRMLAARWRARCPVLAGVAIETRPPLVIGADQLIEEVDGLTLLLRPATFFQVCVSAAETLLALARENLRLSGSERLLDLYCGAGVFTLPLARQAREALGIESWAGAVDDARASAELNQVTNARFVVGPVERALADIREPVDAVVLDPPRRGCYPAAIVELLRLRPERIVYISCQPATLARDLRALTAGGYRLSRVIPVDVFPQTPHIESVSVLER